eukprot:4701987-Ditylum_brightwellii.AAC.1
MATPQPRTYQQLKTHFTQEYQLLNCMKHTTRTAGYHGMNFATKMNGNETNNEEAATAQLEEAASQFVAVNTQGQQTMAQLAATNAQLQQQVQNLQQQLQMNMQMMMMVVANNNSQRRGNQGGHGGGCGS